MKRIRIVSFLFALLLTLLLVGCSQSEAAKALDEQITAIGLVTEQSVGAIEAAEATYNAMDAKEQKQVKNRETLFAARETYSKIQADKVIAQIDKIGNVTKASKQLINIADNSYNNLTDQEKGFVTNASTLHDAKIAYSQIVAKEVDESIEKIGKVTLDKDLDIMQAERAYYGLSEEEQAYVTKADTLFAAKEEYNTLRITDVETAINNALNKGGSIVDANNAYKKLPSELKGRVSNYSELEKAIVTEAINAINAIGTVTVDSGVAIESAETAYNNLDSEAKKLVSNYNTLVEAKTAFEVLHKEALMNKVNEQYDEVAGAIFYTSKQRPQYSNERTYVLPYIVKRQQLVYLRINFNYTGKRYLWIDSVQILTDNQRTMKDFSYDEISRDSNLRGSIFENADIIAEDSDIAVLQKIAKADNAVVRFVGDTYYYDLTVSDSDKQAIADVLALYDYLKS